MHTYAIRHYVGGKTEHVNYESRSKPRVLKNGEVSFVPYNGGVETNLKRIIVVGSVEIRVLEISKH